MNNTLFLSRHPVMQITLSRPRLKSFPVNFIRLSDRSWLARWNYFEHPTLDVRRILK